MVHLTLQHLGGNCILKLNNEDDFFWAASITLLLSCSHRLLNYIQKPTDGYMFNVLACTRGTRSISLLQVAVDAVGPHSCTHSWNRRKQSSASLFELLRKSSSSMFGSQSAARWPSFTHIQTAQIPVKREEGGRQEEEGRLRDVSVH